MLHRLFEIVFCGSCYPSCGRSMCTRWNKSVQGNDAHLWKDLSLFNNIPKPRKPAIPRVVCLPVCKLDDVSTLYEGSLQQLRSEEYFDPTNEDEFPDDLELRVEDDDDSTDLEVDRRFFAELYSTPLKTFRSQRSIYGDGSSYSTQRHHHAHSSSCKSESTDATMQNKNTFTTYLTSSQAMI